MKQLRPAILAVILAIANLAAHAQTQIEGGKTFLLGGEQKKALLVEGRNIGKVAVEVSAKKDGKNKVLQVVQPGYILSQTFGAGEIARFRNTSKTERAVIQFEITKDVGVLSMRYSD